MPHYQRMRRGCDLKPPIGPRGARPIHTGCKTEGCERAHYCKGLCRIHYQRMRRGSDMDAPVDGYGRKRVLTPEDYRCEIEGCKRQRVGKGLCSLHLTRKQYGIPMNAPDPVEVVPCACGYPPYAAGMCRSCYGKMQRRRR